jgi:hypothetical protein
MALRVKDLLRAGKQAGSSRRRFMGLTGVAGAALFSALDLPMAYGDTGPLDANQRRQRAFAIRRDAAMLQRDRDGQTSMDNGDEQLYASRIASFTKGLPHSAIGEVDLNAYNAYLTALGSGAESDFEAIPLGGTVKLQTPQSAYCFGMEGADSHAIASPPAPTFSSAQTAGEMVEDYWAALTRNVPFGQYGSDPTISQAVADLNTLSDYRGPKVKGQVTSDVIFRGPTPGDSNGPYLSQFLWKAVPFGAATFTQTYRTSVASDDFMTNFPAWLAIQRGAAAASNVFDTTPRYIRNNRDLAEYLHRDFTYQAYSMAALLLGSLGNPALAPNNYYLSSATQSGSITFGAMFNLDLVARAAIYALRAVWYQKWLVHRRLRPEAFGGRIHTTMVGTAKYPIHSDVLNSAALPAVFKATGSYLLPMPYPEGSPMHPSYPAAHAAVAGACVTVLKALYNPSFVIPSPVTASDDGLSLVPYTGSALTVGDELNKLASNMSMGRNAGGVHYRSDGIAGLNLGEAVAISMLRDVATIVHEQFSGFTLTRFDGTTVTICPDC